MQVASEQANGDVTMVIPGRGLSRAGGPSHYMCVLPTAHLQGSTGLHRGQADHLQGTDHLQQSRYRYPPRPGYY